MSRSKADFKVLPRSSQFSSDCNSRIFMDPILPAFSTAEFDWSDVYAIILDLIASSSSEVFSIFFCFNSLSRADTSVTKIVSLAQLCC